MEKWRPIKGFEGMYEISTHGRVKSLARQCGTVFRKEMIRRPSYTKDGYLKMRLSSGDKDVTTRIHRLVAEAFIPRVRGKNTVNHKDGDKTNNHVDNLEWADRGEQLQHAYDLGLKEPIRAFDNPQAKLEEDDVKYIRNNFKKGSRTNGASALGRKFGVSHRTILNVVEHKTYK